MRPLYELRGERYNAEPVRQSATDRNDLVLELDGKQSAVHIQRLSNHEALLTIDGLQQRAFVAQDGDTLFIHLDGQTHELTAITEFAAAAGAGGGSGQIKAPMPGVVLECSVAEGDEVTEGQSLMMIESMKLQTEILAPLSGTVATLSVEAGQSFDKGAVLVEIAAAKDDNAEESQ